MSLEIFLFLLILGAAFLLFVFEVFPIDVTALTLLTVLFLVGYLDVGEAISGFSNKAVLTVAAMLVLSRALVKTGFLEVFADQLSSLAGKNIWLGLSIFLLAASLISGFINNTATVAIFIPLALQLSQRFQISPSKILIPLSYAAIYGGTLTLIGTSTNLLVSSVVEDYGIQPLGMFEFAGMGLIFLITGTIYNLWVVPKILPSRAAVSSLTRSYHMSPYLTEFKVAENSPLIGVSCMDRGVNENYDITILALIRDKQRYDSDIRNIKLQKGDILLSRGTFKNFLRFREEEKVLLLTEVKMSQTELTGDESVIIEGLIPPGSSLIGKSLKELDFRNKFGAFVLAIRREGKTLREKIAHIVLHFADTLLIFVPKSNLSALDKNPDIAVLQEHEISLHKTRFWWLAIAIIPLIMISATLGIIEILGAAIVGVVILLLVRSLNIQEAYRSIDWSVIVLIAAFIPVGIVVERTGTADLIGSGIINLGALFKPEFAPYASLSILYLVAVLMTSIMSNNSAAIVLIPVALSIGNQLGVDIRPFIFTICFGASTSFMTPMGYQTNLMVYGPGSYRFGDFVKAGAPLNVLFWLLATIFIPMIWPFYPG
ncbi:MAG: SLC13 family permease [Candidatus Marinimicrobia bacterium]|nr:SLC13 family permease [Candidatus Neomarinimicrobiota bacterium]